METLLLVLLAASEPRPTTLPSYSTQCIETRAVVCADDADLNGEDCMAMVLPVIQEINEAADRQVYAFAGILTAEGAKIAYDAGIYIITADKLDRRFLGLTIPIVKDMGHQSCIVKVATMLNTRHFNDSDYDFRAVLLHEMLHGLGFDHASPTSHFVSIMEVNYNPKAPHLTPADRRSVRTVYSPWERQSLWDVLGLPHF